MPHTIEASAKIMSGGRTNESAVIIARNVRTMLRLRGHRALQHSGNDERQRRLERDARVEHRSGDEKKEWENPAAACAALVVARGLAQAVTSTSSFVAGVNTSGPLAVTSTVSSMRTPPTPGT